MEMWGRLSPTDYDDDPQFQPLPLVAMLLSRTVPTPAVAAVAHLAALATAKKVTSTTGGDGRWV